MDTRGEYCKCSSKKKTLSKSLTKEKNNAVSPPLTVVSTNHDAMRLQRILEIPQLFAAHLSTYTYCTVQTVTAHSDKAPPALWGGSFQKHLRKAQIFLSVVEKEKWEVLDWWADTCYGIPTFVNLWVIVKLFVRTFIESSVVLWCALNRQKIFGQTTVFGRLICLISSCSTCSIYVFKVPLKTAWTFQLFHFR